MKVVVKAHRMLKFKLPYLLALVFLLNFSPNGFAQNKHVYDYAKIYQPELTTRYDSLLQDIENKMDLRIEAAILPNFGSDKPKDVITYLQQQIIDKKPTLENHVLLVVSIDDGFAMVLPSSSLTTLYSEINKKEITDKIKQDIQSGSYDQILKNGLGGIIHYYDQATTKAEKKTTPMTLLRDNLLLVGVGVVIFIIFRFGRRKARIIR